MFALSLSRPLSARGIHYGWMMVALTLLSGLCSSAAMSIPGVLIVSISNDLGWSVGEISYAMAMRLFLFGLIAPFAGALLLRYGLVRMIAVSAVLIVIGLVMTITMTERWQLWLGTGVLLGIAPGMTALVVSATVASRWFTARRGLVVGLLGAAIATGQLLFFPLAAWMAEAYGWRVALLPPLAAVIVSAVLYQLFAKDYPSDVEQPPFGEDAVLPRTAPPSANAVSISFNALRSASGTPVFWVLFATFFICGASTLGLMTPHFVPFCLDYGVAQVTAASFLALMGIFDFAGTIGSGWLSDRHDSRWLLSWYYALRGLSLIWLPFSDFSVLGLSIFAIFFGLDYVATVPPTVKLAVQSFGRDQGPVVFGWIFAGHQMGAATMAAVAGASRDMLSTYVPVFFLSGVACVVAAMAMALLTGPRSPKALQARPRPA